MLTITNLFLMSTSNIRKSKINILLIFVCSISFIQMRHIWAQSGRSRVKWQSRDLCQSHWSGQGPQWASSLFDCAAAKPEGKCGVVWHWMNEHGHFNCLTIHTITTYGNLVPCTICGNCIVRQPRGRFVAVSLPYWSFERSRMHPFSIPPFSNPPSSNCKQNRIELGRTFDTFWNLLEPQGTKFVVDELTGEIKTNKVFDREGDDGRFVSVTVKATDRGSPPLEGVCSFKVGTTPPFFGSLF